MVTILDEQRRGIALGAIGYLTKPIGLLEARKLMTAGQCLTQVCRRQC